MSRCRNDWWCFVRWLWWQCCLDLRGHCHHRAAAEAGDTLVLCRRKQPRDCYVKPNTAYFSLSSAMSLTSATSHVFSAGRVHIIKPNRVQWGADISVLVDSSPYKMLQQISRCTAIACVYQSKDRKLQGQNRRLKLQDQGQGEDLHRQSQDKDDSPRSQQLVLKNTSLLYRQTGRTTRLSFQFIGFCRKQIFLWNYLKLVISTLSNAVSRTFVSNYLV